jgi:Homeodomain-like domain
MPWKVCKPMDERLKFVARLLDGEKMAVACREFGISRKTGYKILAETAEASEIVCDAQVALMRTKPTTVAGAAAILRYVAAFWVDGDESSEKRLPIYETLAHDEPLHAGDNFLPMIADALDQIGPAR